MPITGDARDNHLMGGNGADAIAGGVGDDVLDGLAGDDILLGEQGDDVLEGGDGSDLLDGGTATDTATYAHAQASVVVDLSVDAWQDTGGAGIDRLISIEYLYGSRFDDVLTGDGGANLIQGDDGEDRLYGGGGDDRLKGGNGDDWIDGGDADDDLRGGQGGDTLVGGRGSDQLFGQTGDDLLAGGGGHNLLDGGDGWDRVSYAAEDGRVNVFNGAVTVYDRNGVSARSFDTLTSIEDITGSAFNDRIIVSNNLLSTDEHLHGGDGNDYLYAGRGNDVLDGGTGDDTLVSTGPTRYAPTVVTFAGGDGVDTIEFIYEDLGAIDLRRTDAQVVNSILTVVVSGVENIRAYRGTLYGNDGDNRLELFEAGSLYGLGGNDILVDGAGSNGLYGGDGDDIVLIKGQGAFSVVDGGDGFDTLSFERLSSDLIINMQNRRASSYDVQNMPFVNFERVVGGKGDDSFIGNGHRGVLEGGAGDDHITGGGRHTTLVGGAGDDFLSGSRVSYYDAPAGVAVDLALKGVEQDTIGAGRDTLYGVTNLIGSAFDDRLYGAETNDSLTGDDGADILLGRGGDDLLVGGAGADHLEGGAGADILRGGSGADVLIGGLGADRLRGDRGADTFRFLSALDSTAAAADRIEGLSADDRLDLTAIDADIASTGDQAFHWVSALGGHAGELMLAYDAQANESKLLGDIDGDGTADFQVLLMGDVTSMTGSWLL